ncbi:MAG: Ppx/GppA family phosphatase [Myxococcales bacterium]|nr:Ppx/GppA family phosphatase [Myxococcales bacterium]MCB9754548.1 Ppx/GppA family phosphatase [Myxococcales bacterium]
MNSGAPSGWQAVIDIGTNTALMLVARRRADGSLEIRDDLARITRLGEGVARTGRLAPAAIERTLAALRAHREYAARCGAALQAVATEGVRLASNPGDFLEPAAALLGAPIRVISGDEEAALSYRSVALEVAGDAPLRVLDIGGASTELVAGVGPSIASAMSHKIGSVRLTESLLAGQDPPSRDGVAAVTRAAREAFARQPLEPCAALHGLAGTVTTTAALLLELETYERARVDGASFSREQVASLRDRLAGQTLAERVRTPCLPEGRADVIVAGVAILVAAMEHCGASTLVCRDRGLRYALIE